MTLKEGLYTIRYVPVGIHPPFEGGVFAKSGEIGEPILLETANSKHPAQIWEVHEVSGEKGKYTITLPGFKSKLAGIGPVLLGWSLSNPSDKFPGGDILFKANYVQLLIEPVGSGAGLMYSLHVPNPEGTHHPSLDSQFYIAEKDHHLVSQAYYSSLSVSRPHPHWQFIPAERH